MRPINKGTMFSQLDEMRVAMGEEDYPITGFIFYLDDENFFNPYCQESADIAGFPFCSGMPEVKGFFYTSKEYQEYLDALIESGKEHPSNTEDLPWAEDFSDDALQTI